MTHATKHTLSWLGGGWGPPPPLKKRKEKNPDGVCSRQDPWFRIQGGFFTVSNPTWLLVVHVFVTQMKYLSSLKCIFFCIALARLDIGGPFKTCFLVIAVCKLFFFSMYPSSGELLALIFFILYLLISFCRLAVLSWRLLPLPVAANLTSSPHNSPANHAATYGQR